MGDTKQYREDLRVGLLSQVLGFVKLVSTPTEAKIKPCISGEK